MVNEFHTLNGTCTTLVPSGPGYENATLANQVCTTIGSQPGMSTVPGGAYTYVSFGYSYSNLWRVCDRFAYVISTESDAVQNLGILWIFTFGMLGALLFFTQYNKRTAWDTTVTLYKEGSDRVPISQVVDEEKVTPGDLHGKRKESDAVDNSIPGIVKSEKPGRADIFSWKNIQYEVPISGWDMRKLLDDVSGYVAPGNLTALMGETGAGKVGIRGVGSVGADRWYVLTDGVIECTRSTHLGRCRAW